MKIRPLPYRGFYIEHDYHKGYYITKDGDLFSQICFGSVKSGQKIIDTYLDRERDEILPKKTPPISEQKLIEVVSRPEAIYSNKNHNQ